MENIKTAAELARIEATKHARFFTGYSPADTDEYESAYNHFESGYLKALEYASLQSSKDKERIARLEQVANVAALCIIDLNSNLNSAHEEFMKGELNNGAYQYVLGRHGTLLASLHEAGYTEKHPLFDFPVNPKETLSGEPVVSKDKEEIERLKKQIELLQIRDEKREVRFSNANSENGRLYAEIEEQQQRIAELEEMLRRAIGGLDRVEWQLKAEIQDLLKTTLPSNPL